MRIGLTKGNGIWQMAKICRKWRIYLGIGLSVCYLGNDVDLLGNGKYVGKWLNYLTKYLKNMENGLEIWEMAKIFGKWLKYLKNGLTILEMA